MAPDARAMELRAVSSRASTSRPRARWSASTPRRTTCRRRTTADATREDEEARRRPARHYVNLKNGVEALPFIRDVMHVRRYDYCRIQSSLLEAGHVERVITELDSSLMLDLALGRACFVWDYGSRDVVKGKGNPRALWYGLEFVRYALRKEWFPGTEVAEKAIAVTRGKRVDQDFDRKLTMLDRSTKRKIRYYRQFIPESVSDVRLIGVYRATTHDDDTEFYRSVLHANELTNELFTSDAPPSPRYEAETIEAIERLGKGEFNLYFSGAEEPAWLNQKAR